ncbi:hypothetical protein Cme02nite_49940 [Catellatospora methionotrophica]|uniref:Uncharacterized protein n=1 Tax=Catellatospora methionotrophica TaxID=121620 RepID=A0A8J3L946_9ACTN|nr:hypothetical protein Cme02nite_49940 [Catellatospora methionotrophica]
MRPAGLGRQLPIRQQCAALLAGVAVPQFAQQQRQIVHRLHVTIHRECGTGGLGCVVGRLPRAGTHWLVVHSASLADHPVALCAGTASVRPFCHRWHITDSTRP